MQTYNFMGFFVLPLNRPLSSQGTICFVREAALDCGMGQLCRGEDGNISGKIKHPSLEKSGEYCNVISHSRHLDVKTEIKSECFS